MRRYEFYEEENALKQKLIENCEGLTTPRVSIRENYHPLTGEGLNAEHFSWSDASLILLLEEYLPIHCASFLLFLLIQPY